MLIIVESPTKAKKIQSILKLRALSTVGHFKDLPDAQIGVDLKTYEPTFVYHERKKHLPDELRAAAKGETVMLAGDPDREGYAISCHIYEEVKSVAKECLRMEIYEVTEKGLKEALAKAVPFEQTNTGLYNAFLGRRIGDRLVGYILSPITSKSLHGKYSVGRVQSPAVRLIVDREREIKDFVPSLYWMLDIQLVKDGATFLARHVKGKLQKLPDAEKIVAVIRGETHVLATKVEKKEVKQSPKPPFTTVDLQAAAAVRLKFSPEQTMKLAQGLFDQGIITYHRTDSVRMDEAFIKEIRAFLGKALGVNYLPKKSNQHKSKNSQAEAHEGIRPTHMHSTADIASIIKKEGLTADHAKLYEIIFKRAVASQMASAIFDSTIMLFEAAGEKFKAAGRVLNFDGFLKVYAEVDEEKEKKKDEDKLQLLPPIEVGELVPKLKEVLEEKKTKAPGRFTLGSLVKELERLDIGQPFDIRRHHQKHYRPWLCEGTKRESGASPPRGSTYRLFTRKAFLGDRLRTDQQDGEISGSGGREQGNMAAILQGRSQQDGLFRTTNKSCWWWPKRSPTQVRQRPRRKKQSHHTRGNLEDQHGLVLMD